MRRFSLCLVSLLLPTPAVVAAQAPAAAAIVAAPPQQSPAPERCRPEASRRGCGGFWITEVGFAGRVHTTVPGGSRYYGYLETGWMLTTGAQTGVGAAPFVGFDGDEVRFGVEVRGRLWLHDDWSVEVAPGLQFVGHSSEVGTVAGMGHAALSYRDLAALTVHREAHEDGLGSQASYFAGLTLGSKPGRYGMIAAAAVAVGALLTFLDNFTN